MAADVKGIGIVVASLERRGLKPMRNKSVQLRR